MVGRKSGNTLYLIINGIEEVSVMKLYTFAHVMQVFILGVIGGFFIGGLFISIMKSRRVTEKRFRVIQGKRKIPSAANTEYPIVSCKNY